MQYSMPVDVVCTIPVTYVWAQTITTLVVAEAHGGLGHYVYLSVLRPIFKLERQRAFIGLWVYIEQPFI